ncbi:RNA polymerase II transcription elongation factor-domain-containing protein [Scheffersomyces amazonensis]|uniref:RNA polymerase II transcription elongation factor-domain-containing protein n=1 Tax=Scheffersomyces amazonensis TaxID=1078765 RepID=UPI00315CF6BA
MSLADGEYDIDLSGLIDVPTNSTNRFGSNIALRYNFIPDSMDQSKPLRLYQSDKDCLMKASSVDGGDDKPIIFEAIPQISSNVNNDSYFLSFSNTSNTLQLNRLQTTYRLSKSRNVSKLLPKIQQWDKAQETAKSSPTKRSKKLKQKIEPRDSTPKPAPIVNSTSTLMAKVKKSDSNTSTISPVRSKPKSLVNVSSKRPPTANNTPLEEPIINESDFDDLDDDSDKDDNSDFPIIDFDNKETDVKDIRQPQKVESVITKQEKQSQPRAKVIEKVSDDPEIEDDFKDLEDQLQEVLEEDDEDDIILTELSPLKVTVDSDESDADDLNFGGIKIDVSNDVKPTKKNRFTTNWKSDGKPTSLRDFVGDDKRDDDLSVSEEE